MVGIYGNNETGINATNQTAAAVYPRVDRPLPVPVQNEPAPEYKDQVRRARADRNVAGETVAIASAYPVTTSEDEAPLQYPAEEC